MNKTAFSSSGWIHSLPWLVFSHCDSIVFSVMHSFLTTLSFMHLFSKEIPMLLWFFSSFLPFLVLPLTPPLQFCPKARLSYTTALWGRLSICGLLTGCSPSPEGRAACYLWLSPCGGSASALCCGSSCSVTSLVPRLVPHTCSVLAGF